MIDRAIPTVIARRSTRGKGIFAKKRWVEIRLLHMPASPTPFMVEIRKCSEMPGEHTIRTKHLARTLDLALERLDDSQPARAVARQAREWEEGGNA